MNHFCLYCFRLMKLAVGSTATQVFTVMPGNNRIINRGSAIRQEHKTAKLHTILVFMYVWVCGWVYVCSERLLFFV